MLTWKYEAVCLPILTDLKWLICVWWLVGCVAYHLWTDGEEQMNGDLLVRTRGINKIIKTQLSVACSFCVLIVTNNLGSPDGLEHISVPPPPIGYLVRVGRKSFRQCGALGWCQSPRREGLATQRGVTVIDLRLLHYTTPYLTTPHHTAPSSLLAALLDVYWVFLFHIQQTSAWHKLILETSQASAYVLKTIVG